MFWELEYGIFFWELEYVKKKKKIEIIISKSFNFVFEIIIIFEIIQKKFFNNFVLEGKPWVLKANNHMCWMAQTLPSLISVQTPIPNHS